ncbi:hypothetical protein N9F48_04055 [Akkermansiaceae bacterium]|nr:hypothetical protein [Akkermansiaceae bacterium]
MKFLLLMFCVAHVAHGNEEEGKKAIVSYVISFPTRTPSADPFSDDPIEKAKIDPLVSHDGKDVSFTSVLDALCVQAGYVWSISQHEEGWSFVLVEYKDSVK